MSNIYVDKLNEAITVLGGEPVTEPAGNVYVAKLDEVIASLTAFGEQFEPVLGYTPMPIFNRSDIFNNAGNLHTTNTDFNSLPATYGSHFVGRGYGNTTVAHGPGIPGAAQYYGFTIGLGTEYDTTSEACQIYWPRSSFGVNGLSNFYDSTADLTGNGGNPYISIRFKEGTAGNSWSAWRKIYAGYADSAGYASSIAVNDNWPNPQSADIVPPNWAYHRVRFDLATGGTSSVPSAWAGVMTYVPYDGTYASTGGASYQLSFGNSEYYGAGLPILNVRSGIDSYWNTWHTLLHSGNYSSYAAPVAHTHSQYVTSTGNVSYASIAASLRSGESWPYRDSTPFPNWSDHRVRFDIASGQTAGVLSWLAGIMTYVPYDGTSASTGDASYQLAFGGTVSNGYGEPMLNIRKGIDTTWNAWREILHSSGYITSAPPATGYISVVVGGVTYKLLAST